MKDWDITDDFLPAGTELLAAVKPEPNISPALWTHLEGRDIHASPPKEPYVRFRLEENLKIRFKLHPSGLIRKDLIHCRCTIPSLPNEHIGSVNSAYQKITAAYEPSRDSVGGRVYDYLYYQISPNVWRLLEERREELYRPYQVKFEKRKREILESAQKPVEIRLPIGNSLIIRRDPRQPLFYYLPQLKALLDDAPLVAQNEHFIVFGSLDEENLMEYHQKLMNYGLEYGRDFVDFHHALPDWCNIKLSA